METTSGSWTRSGRFWALAFGSATSTPWWSMGAAIMKMMSSTSITSTRGVTLMSAITGSSSPSPLPKLKAISPGPLGEIPLGQVEEFEHEVVHPRAQPAHVLGEVVVGDEGGNGGGEAGGGVDQRLGDAGGHGHDRGRALEADVVEGLHDAPHRAKKADERGGGGGGGEEARPAGHRLQLDVDGPRQRPFEGGDRGDAVSPFLARPLRRRGVLDLTVDFGVARLEDAHERRGAELAGDGVDLAEALAAVEGLHELLALPAGAAEVHQLAEDDGPRAEREEDQDAEDDLRHRAGLEEKPEDSGPLLGAELNEHQGRREHAGSLRSLLRRDLLSRNVPPGERTMAPDASKGRAG